MHFILESLDPEVSFLTPFPDYSMHFPPHGRRNMTSGCLIVDKVSTGACEGFMENLESKFTVTP